MLSKHRRFQFLMETLQDRTTKSLCSKIILPSIIVQFLFDCHGSSFLQGENDNNSILYIFSEHKKKIKFAVRKRGIVEKKAHLLNYYNISCSVTSLIISLEWTYILSVITAHALILFNIKQIGKDNQIFFPDGIKTARSHVKKGCPLYRELKIYHLSFWL